MLHLVGTSVGISKTTSEQVNNRFPPENCPVTFDRILFFALIDRSKKKQQLSWFGQWHATKGRTSRGIFAWDGQIRVIDKL